MMADDVSFRYSVQDEPWHEPDDFRQLVEASPGAALKRCLQIRGTNP